MYLLIFIVLVVIICTLSLIYKNLAILVKTLKKNKTESIAPKATTALVKKFSLITPISKFLVDNTVFILYNIFLVLIIQAQIDIYNNLLKSVENVLEISSKITEVLDNTTACITQEISTAEKTIVALAAKGYDEIALSYVGINDSLVSVKSTLVNNTKAFSEFNESITLSLTDLQNNLKEILGTTPNADIQNDKEIKAMVEINKNITTLGYNCCNNMENLSNNIKRNHEISQIYSNLIDTTVLASQQIMDASLSKK